MPLKQVAALSLLPFMALRAASAASYYVSPGGSNSNNGLSQSLPYETIDYAVSNLVAGDTLYVMDGAYTNAVSTDFAAQLHQSGTASAPITIAALPGAHPSIVIDGPGGFNIDGSYWIIRGLEFIGQNHLISMEEAQSADVGNSYYSSVGVVVWSNSTFTVQHVTIEDSIVHDFPGGGIQVGHADWITIQRNVVFNNAWYGRNAGSGISIYEPNDADDDTTSMKIIVRNNVTHHNRNFIPWYKTGTITDGNGIILDDFLHVQSDRAPYRGNSLVYNNLSYLNGGSGIHAFSSQNATIADNTAYLNNQTPSMNEGQMFVYASYNIRVANNIMVAPAGKIANYANKNTNVQFLYNIYDGGTGPVIVGDHDLVVDPLFVDPLNSDFRLMPGSPAIGSGSSEYVYSNDLAGVSRPQGTGQDRGAYQYGGP